MINTIEEDTKCPVCGALSFSSTDFPGSYEICPTCNWEDDPVQYEDPDFEGGQMINL